MGRDIDSLLNRANNSYEAPTNTLQESTSKEITSVDVMAEIERIKQLNLPNELKQAALTEAQELLREIQENEQLQNKETTHIFENNHKELKQLIETVIEEKLTKFLKNKIILNENEIQNTEIGIVIDGMVFKGKLKRIK